MMGVMTKPHHFVGSLALGFLVAFLWAVALTETLLAFILCALLIIALAATVVLYEAER